MMTYKDVVTEYGRAISVAGDPNGKVLEVRSTESGKGTLAILTHDEAARVAELLLAPPPLRVGDVLVKQSGYESVVIYVLPDVVVSRDTDDGSFRAYDPDGALEMRDRIGGAR